MIDANPAAPLASRRASGAGLVPLLTVGFWRTGPPHQPASTAPLLLLVGFLAAGLYVPPRCPVYNSVKYVIQVMPVWLLVGYWLGARGLPDRRWRTAFRAVVVVLFGTAAGRTFDPVSLAIFGRYDGEAHTMLCMNSTVRPTEEERCGNDEMNYNLQPFLS